MIISKRSRNAHKRFKKIVLALLLLFLGFGYQYFSDFQEIKNGKRFAVTLDKTIDGDTAWFKTDKQSVKVRFLYIDTPESTNKSESYGKQASTYVDKQLHQAKLIELETNRDGNLYDKYERLLAWVFVDGQLLQEKIAREGYCQKFYDYGYDYTYKNDIIKANEEAVKYRRGIYSQTNE